MAVALLLVHFPQHQPFVGGGPGGSFELPLVYLAIMVALLGTGPGAYSVDSLVFGHSGVAMEQRTAVR
jgi:uncharacterized membrane protein YphA (DoxX/SURF4 family)